MLKQLSIFAENKKGIMQDMTQILLENDINILGHQTNESGEFGTVRMIVSDPAKAREALAAAGYLCKLTNVIGAELPDETGSLNALLKVVSDCCVSMDHTYLSFNRKSGMPVLIIHTEDAGEVEQAIVRSGYKSVRESEIR